MITLGLDDQYAHGPHKIMLCYLKASTIAFLFYLDTVVLQKDDKPSQPDVCDPKESPKKVFVAILMSSIYECPLYM